MKEDPVRDERIAMEIVVDCYCYIFVSRKPHELALWMNGNKLKVTENCI